MWVNAQFVRSIFVTDAVGADHKVHVLAFRVVSLEERIEELEREDAGASEGADAFASGSDAGFLKWDFLPAGVEADDSARPQGSAPTALGRAWC